MKIDVVQGAPEGVEADVLVFPVPDPVALPETARALDSLVEGRLSHLVEDGELKGEEGCVTLVHSEGRIAAHRIAAAGVGNGALLDADRLRT
ncbi:MAG: M17 family peptidase N-terminal domain-containing protein, partial [Gaiellaceae bacterium]